MIRKLETQDFDRAVDIWLRASCAAHSFVPAAFWEERAQAMRAEYLPAAESWGIEDDGALVGFFSLVDESLAAIFIDPDRQGEGLGSALIGRAMSLRERLELSVYEENPSAVAFYRKHGFEVIETRLDEHTGHRELVMEWRQQ